MKIVISDENAIWTVDHPALEPFAESVYVVCLNGEKVTDKYPCFVSDYKPAGAGASGIGKNSAKYRRLEEAARQLVEELGPRGDIVFLTDGEPAGLFPFHAVRAVDRKHSLHLVAVSPWEFDKEGRKKAHRLLLRDLHFLNSFLYLDVNRIQGKSAEPEKSEETGKAKESGELKESGKSGKSEEPEEAGRSPARQELISAAKKKCGDLLPEILDQIRHREWKKAYFDFHSMKYVPVEKGGFPADLDPGGEKVIPGPESDPAWEEELRETESPEPRVDGKIVCMYLKILRMRLARANGIPYESVMCPSVGPCAGTCAKCDGESAWLRDEMEKIPAEKRVYPKLTLDKWGEY